MIQLDCICANTRRAARLITQVYGREMGAALEPSQFLLLSVLAKKPGLPQVVLGDALGYDKTTLSRSLRLMSKNGWIVPAKSPAKTADRRAKGYRVTAGGKALLAATQPRWETAQKKMLNAMNEDEWNLVSRAFEIVSRVAADLR